MGTTIGVWIRWGWIRARGWCLFCREREEQIATDRRGEEREVRMGDGQGEWEERKSKRERKIER